MGISFSELKSYFKSFYYKLDFFFYKYDVLFRLFYFLHVVLPALSICYSIVYFAAMLAISFPSFRWLIAIVAWFMIFSVLRTVFVE